MRVVFAGTPDFAAAHLAALLHAIDEGRAPALEIAGVISQPDKPGKRGRQLLPPPVKQLALERELELIQPPRLDASALAPLFPDIVVVVAYGQILRAELLELPRHGCVNVHASLLPRWRGAAPIQRAILAGDAETGVCIMKMDAGLDTGDVYTCRRTPIADTDTASTLAGKLALLGSEALLQTLDEIAAGTAHATPQSDDGVTWAPKIDKLEAQIDWHRPAADVDRQIRAFNPDPVAFSFLGELRTRIWEATVAADVSTTPSPGEILRADKRGIVVACGDGAISISRLQLPVGKGTVQSAADVLNAGRQEFAPGHRFSS